MRCFFNAKIAIDTFASMSDVGKTNFIADLASAAKGTKKMKSIMEFLNGKKTYITAALIAGAGIAAAFGYAIPEWVWASLAALGLTVNRVAITKVADAVTAVKDEVKQ